MKMNKWTILTIFQPPSTSRPHLVGQRLENGQSRVLSTIDRGLDGRTRWSWWTRKGRLLLLRGFGLFLLNIINCPLTCPRTIRCKNSRGVDEPTPAAVGALTWRSIRATNFRFILGVPSHLTQLMVTMSELAFMTVSANALLHPGPAQFGFIQVLLLHGFWCWCWCNYRGHLTSFFFQIFGSSFVGMVDGPGILTSKLVHIDKRRLKCTKLISNGIHISIVRNKLGWRSFRMRGRLDTRCCLGWLDLHWRRAPRGAPDRAVHTRRSHDRK